MYKLILFLGISSAFGLGIKQTIPSKNSEKFVGCYHIIDVPYNDPQPDLIKKGIDASLCNHLIYSFVGIGPNGSILTESPDGDTDLDTDQFNHFNGRWKSNPRIKTLLHMAALEDEYESNPWHVLTDPHIRGKVVNSIVDYLQKFAFDGIVLDLDKIHYIVKHAKNDTQNLVLLLKALKEKFAKEDFILSVSVDPREETTNKLYDIKGISTYVNFIYLMAFNFHGPYLDERMKLGHTSPLYRSKKENPGERNKNIDYVVRYWIRNGAPANKLILGTTLTAESYTLVNTKETGIGAPYTKEGKYPRLGYSNICAWSKQQEWNYSFDEEQKVPYIHKGHQILAIENVDSMTEKAEYVNKMYLGGAVVQYLDEDDFAGKCGEKFAILKALNRVLRKKY